MGLFSDGFLSVFIIGIYEGNWVLYVNFVSKNSADSEYQLW